MIDPTTWAPPTPGTAQRSGEGHQRRRPPHAAPEGSQTAHQGARRESVPCAPPLGPAGMNPRREEITTPARGARGQERPRGPCTDAGQRSAGPPQVKAVLTLDCKSVASGRPLGRRSSIVRRHPQGRLRRRCALPQAPPFPRRRNEQSGQYKGTAKSAAQDPIHEGRRWSQPWADVLHGTLKRLTPLVSWSRRWRSWPNRLPPQGSDLRMVVQGGEVQPTLPPHHQLSVEHHPLLRKRGEVRGDVGEGVGGALPRPFSSDPAGQGRVRAAARSPYQ
jgi:hypothetical protein